MPSLYGENLSYNQTGGTGMSNARLAALQRYRESIANRIPSASSTAVQQPKSGVPLMDPRLRTPAEMFPTLALEEGAFQPTIGEFIAPAPEWSTLPVSSYNQQFPDNPLLSKVGFSPTAKIVNVPSTILGGGQYLADPSRPGDVQSMRPDYSARENQLLLGNLPNNRYEIDHFIPIWADGADTLANKMVLTKEEHAKKTALQAVPYTLYFYSELLKKPFESLNPGEQQRVLSMTPEEKAFFSNPDNLMSKQRAALMARDYQNRSATDVPALKEDAYGLHSLSDAIRISQEWSQMPKVTAKDVWKNIIPGTLSLLDKMGGFIDKKTEEVLSGVPVLGAGAYGALKGAANEAAFGYLRKLFPSAYEEDRDRVLSPGEQLNALWLVKDLAKKRDDALVKGNQALAQQYGDQMNLVKDVVKNPNLLVPTKEQQEIEKINETAEKVGEVIGSLVGGGAAFAKLANVARGAFALAKGQTALSSMPYLGRVFSGFGKAPKTAKEAKEALAISTQIGKEANKVLGNSIGPVSASMFPALAGAVKAGKIIIDPSQILKAQRALLYKQTAKLMGLSVAFGEVHQQDDRSLDAMLNRGFWNLAYGGLLGYQKHDLYGYVLTATSAAAIGAVETGDIREALMNAAMITTMHGAFHRQQRPFEKQYMQTKKEIVKNAEKAGDYVAEKYLSKFGVVPDPGDSPLTYRPSEKYTNMSPDERINARATVIRRINEMAQNQIAVDPNGKIVKAGWDRADLEREYLRANTALRQLDYGGMSEIAKTKAQQADLRSFIEGVRARERSMEAATPKLIEEMINNNPEYLFQFKKDSAIPGMENLKNLSLDQRINARAQMGGVMPDGRPITPDMPIGSTTITGVGGGLSQMKANNVREFMQAVKNGTAAEHLILAHRPELEPHYRSLESSKPKDKLLSGELVIDQNPQNTVVVYGVVKDADGALRLLDLGYLPTKHRLNDSFIAKRDTFGRVQRDANGNVLPEKKTAFNAQEWVRRGTRSELNLDKDTVANYLASRGLKATYADFGVIKMDNNIPAGKYIRNLEGKETSVELTGVTKMVNGKLMAEMANKQLVDISTLKRPGDAEFGKIELDAGGQNPFIRIDVTPDNLAIGEKDFVNTSRLGAQDSDVIRPVLAAVEAKTPAEASAAMKVIEQRMPVEPADVLLSKVLPENVKMPEALRTQTATNKAVVALTEAKTSAEFKKTMNEHFGPIFKDGPEGDAMAAKWFENKDSLTTRTFFEALRDSANDGNAFARTLYSESVIPFLKSAEFQSIPANKAILESPLLGNAEGRRVTNTAKKEAVAPKAMTEDAYTTDKPLPAVEEARMESVMSKSKATEATTPDPSKLPQAIAKVATEAKAQPAKKVSPDAKIEIEEPVLKKATTEPVKTAEAPKEAPKVIPKKVVQTEITSPEVMKATSEPMIGEKATAERVERPMQPDFVEPVLQPNSFNELSKQGLGSLNTLFSAKKATLKRGSPEWNDINSKQKALTGEAWNKEMRRIAKFDKDGNLDMRSFPEFRDVVSKTFSDMGFSDPMKSKANERVLQHLFQRTLEAGPAIKRARVVMDKNDVGLKFEQAHTEPRSDIERKFKKVFGKDADIIYVQDQDNLTRNMSPDEVVAKISKSMEDQGYVPITSTGNDVNTFFGVKYDPKIAAMYDQNPAKYKSKKFPENDPKTDIDKFVRVFLTETTPLGPNSTKRELKYLRNATGHEIANAARDAKGNVRTYRVKVAKPMTLGEEGLVDTNFVNANKASAKFHGNKQEFEKVVKDVLGRNKLDGVVLTTDATLRDMRAQNAMHDGGGYLKFSGVVSKVGGENVVQKGNIYALSKHEMAELKAKTGIEVKDFDLITFDDNIKIGKNAIKDTPEFDIPATDMYLKWTSPHQTGATVSPQALSKARADVDLASLKDGRYKKDLEKWNNFNEELINAKSGQQIRDTFKKYNDDFNLREQDLYHKVLTSIKNGAGARSVGRQLEDLSLGVLKNQILSGRKLPGDYMHLRPDMGMYDVFNPETKRYETRHLKTNEVAMSFNKLKELGLSTDPRKEQYVLVNRSPITRETAMIKARVVPVDPRKFALGDDTVSLSHHDVFVRLEGDYDGDAVTILKIGDKGIPEAFGDRIDMNREAMGDMLLRPLEKYDESPINATTMREYAIASMRGGQEIEKTASAMRIMNDLQDAKISFKRNKDKLDVYSNETLIDSVPLNQRSTLREGQEIRPVWDGDMEFKAATYAQEAVDAVSSPALFKRFSDGEFRDTSQMLLGDVFGTSDVRTINAIQQFIRKMQAPYRVQSADSSLALQNELATYSDLVSKINKAGGEVGHMGQIVDMATNLKKFNPINDYIALKADMNASSILKKIAKGQVTDADLNMLGMTNEEVKALSFYGKQKELNTEIIKANEELVAFNKEKKQSMSPLAAGMRVVSLARQKAFIDTQKWRAGMSEETAKYGDYIKKVRQSLEEQIYPAMTDKQKEAFNYWLLTDDKANIKYAITSDQEFNYVAQELKGHTFFDPRGARKAGSSQSWRLTDFVDIFSPDMSKAYYGAVENFQKTPQQAENDLMRITRALEKEKTDIKAMISNGKIKDATKISVFKVLANEAEKVPQGDLDQLIEILNRMRLLRR